jgi:hypothetical protein
LALPLPKWKVDEGEAARDADAVAQVGPADGDGIALRRRGLHGAELAGGEPDHTADGDRKQEVVPCLPVAQPDHHVEAGQHQAGSRQNGPEEDDGIHSGWEQFRTI